MLDSFYPEAPLIYRLMLAVWLITPLVLIPVLFRVTAPYGRHTRGGWGPLIPARLGWILMESPAFWVVGILALSGDTASWGPGNWIIIGAHLGHYLFRTYIWPFMLKGGKTMPLSISLSAVFFNLFNGYVLGWYLGHLAGPIGWDDVLGPRFLLGAALMAGGFGLNIWADRKLFSLRKPGETGYKIPQGGLYNLISCPNYFTEIVEWAGFAIMVWALPAWAFWGMVVANLLPRARSNHQWYLQKFADYPKNRKALIPFIW